MKSAQPLGGMPWHALCDLLSLERVHNYGSCLTNWTRGPSSCPSCDAERRHSVLRTGAIPDLSDIFLVLKEPEKKGVNCFNL